MARRKKQRAAVAEDEHGNSASMEKQAKLALLQAIDENPDPSADDDNQSTINQQQDPRKAFLSLFENSKPLRPGMSSKEQRDLLIHVIEEFHKPDALRFFSGLLIITKSTLEDGVHIPETANNEEVDDDDVEADETSSKALLFLRFAAICTQTYFEHVASKRSDSKSERPVETLEEVFQVASELHNSLFELTRCGPDGQATQRAILKLCEAWWHSNGQRREHLISQTVPLFVASAIDDTSSKIELTRLYKIRHALKHIDFEDESSEWLRKNLMRVASSPRCLKFQEGRKFSAHLFQVDPVLVPCVHQAMKAQIPGASKVVLDAYAEIYYRAWKDVEKTSRTGDDESDDEQQAIREHIENEALSDLVYCMIHIAKPSMFRALMKCLQWFHDNNRKAEIEDLLHRLYGPLIWRSLSAANAHVRINTTYVLAEVFPLDQSTHFQSGKQVEKACACIMELLQDEDAKVREAASFAVAKVLSNSWDALPSNEIRSMLNEVVTQHASDATSSGVRAGALDAVTFLLQTPQSHAVLRPLLPKLGNLIHDRVEKVRLAAVRLLEQVKVTPGIKYFDVVSVTDIRARFEEERTNGPVAAALAGLTINSFVPQGDHVKRADRLRRTLQFLQKDPEAALTFYANMSVGCSFQLVAETAILLTDCVTNAIATEGDTADSALHEREEPITIGTKIRREFDVGWFDGEITAVKKRGRYRVLYEDGDQETLEKDIVVEAIADYDSHHNKGKRKRRNLASDDENTHPNRSETGRKKESQTKADVLLISSQTSLIASVAQTICALWHSIGKPLQKASNKKWRQRQIDSLSSSVKDIVEFADQIAATSEDDAVKIRTAMLRCAAWIPSEDANALSAYMQSVFQKIDESTADCAQKSSLSYVSLFFLLDMETEIADSLSNSISGFFEEQESTALFDNSPRTRDQSSSTCPIPVLPPKIALDAVAAVLQDSGPTFYEARSKLIQSVESCEKLSQSLENGLAYFSRVLGSNAFPGQNVANSNIEFSLRCCELYGKLIVHRHAADDNENEDAQKILKWASSTLIQPFISVAHAATPDFQDPDLSRISISTSGSPSGSEADVTKASTRSSSIGSTFRDDIEGFKLITRAAESLLVWVSLFAMECLPLSGLDASVVSNESLRWCQIFQSSNSLSRSLILQAFLRLAIVLGLGHRNFDLLKRLVIEFCDDGDKKNGDILEKSLEKIVAQLRGNSADRRHEYISCIFDGFQSSISKLGSDEAAKLPDSLEELWPTEGGLSSSLESVLMLEEGRLRMIQMAVATIQKELQKPDSISDTLLLWNLRLAWCFHITGPSQASKDAFVSVSPEVFEAGSTARVLAEKVMESIG